MRILLLLAVASPLLALWPRDQDPAAADWQTDVERACTSPRYGLRLAAARKVAKAGGAAVPAVRAYVQKHGANALPQALVDAYADEALADPAPAADAPAGKEPGDRAASDPVPAAASPAGAPGKAAADKTPADRAAADAAVVQLLVEWANDRDFYYRARALRGLALRILRAGERRDELTTLCRSFRDDPAWQMRTHARLGLVLAGDDTALALPETDPRGRALLPMLLLQQGRVPPLQPLLDALGEERTFQEMRWGAQVALEAHKALSTWLGDAHPLAAGGSFPDTATALQAMRDACAKKSGQQLTLPVVRTDTVPFAGGIELLSCKHGDQFVQWTDEGAVHLGIDASVVLRLPAPAWDALTKERTNLVLAETMGAVICDNLRLRWVNPPVHSKAAPNSLPAPVANWLKRLAQAIEEAGQPSLAAALRGGIEQFAAR